jgi:Na+/H+ antiporter NhaD/arsenite permease-like protein
MLAAALILALTYVGVAFTRLPRVNIDRPSAAFTGAILMVIFGVLTFEEAIGGIDFHTLGLLLGMMILVASIKATGLLDLLATKSLSLAATPRRLLVLVIVSTALCSAFLVNDAVVLLFTPIIIRACRARNVNPVPYLIAEAMAANIGSAATIVGNPQNMLIGIASGISFTRFFLYLLPVSLVSTAALILIVYSLYRREFGKDFGAPQMPPGDQGGFDVGAAKRIAPVLVLVVIMFFLSSVIKVGMPLIALGGAALVLVVGKARPSAVIKEVDWVLLLFFAGLFVVIEGAHSSGVLEPLVERMVATPGAWGIASVSLVSTVVSQLVSNVPMTMLAIPVIGNVPGDTLWIALAAGSTLGGNLTLIGAVANIIVVEGADREGARIGFLEFLKVGALVTSVTVALGILILTAEHWAGWLS